MTAALVPSGPSLALIEVASIARGHRVADAMVKRAPVELLRCDPVSPGKLLVLVAGEGEQRHDIGALGIVETRTVAATILSADAAVKAALVRLIEMQLARGIGGKAYFVVTGPLEEVEAAVEAALGAVDASTVFATEIIPAPHADLVERLR